MGLRVAEDFATWAVLNVGVCGLGRSYKYQYETRTNATLESYDTGKISVTKFITPPPILNK